MELNEEELFEIIKRREEERLIAECFNSFGGSTKIIRGGFGCVWALALAIDCHAHDWPIDEEEEEEEAELRLWEEESEREEELTSAMLLEEAEAGAADMAKSERTTGKDNSEEREKVAATAQSTRQEMTNQLR